MRGRKPKHHLTEELSDQICRAIARGKSIEEVCKEPGMPSRWVLDKWRYHNPAFNDSIERARDLRGTYYRDIVLDPILMRMNWRIRCGMYQPRGRAIGKLFWYAKYRSRRIFGKKRHHFGYTLQTGISTIFMRYGGSPIIESSISSTVMPGQFREVPFPP